MGALPLADVEVNQSFLADTGVGVRVAISCERRSEWTRVKCSGGFAREGWS